MSSTLCCKESIILSMANRREFLAAALASMLRAVPLASFRLGVTTDEIGEGLLTALRFLREFGLEYAEIRSVGGKYAEVQPVAKVRQARALMDEHRIKTGRSEEHTSELQS